MEFYEEIDMAFRNSYEVILNGKDASELIKGNVGFFIHHPSKPISKKLLKDMSDYFAGEEEYEKCTKIYKFLNERDN
tara:strand:- start:7116 stop:7346 length:231 start_codon:yes stop_codon:yes gene_type:complete